MSKGKRDKSARAPSEPHPATIRKLFAYARNVWRLLGALGVAIVATSLLELAVPWVIGFQLIDRVIRHRDPAHLPQVVLLLTAIFIGQQVLGFAKDYLQELADQRILCKLRCDLYEQILYLPVSYFDTGKTGDLLARLTGDIETVKGFLETFMQDVVSELIMLVGTLATLFALSHSLTLYLLPSVVLLASSVFLFKKTVKRFSRHVRNLFGQLSAVATETVSGIRVVKAFSAEDLESFRFANKSLALLRTQVKTAKLSSFYSITTEACVFTGTLLVITMAAPWVLAGSFTLGALVAYLSYLNKLYSPVKKLSKINISIQKIVAAGDRIFEVLDASPEIAFRVPELQARAQSLGFNGITSSIPGQLEGGVRFDRVSFCYDSGTQVFRNFDLDVHPGEVIALVGASGAGKTTVVNLLLGFYKPESGRILLDGVPLERFPLRMLRRQIGLVSQDTFLFSGTVRDNIAYANVTATDEEIMAAARAANAHDFIVASPQGYQLEVGERGAQLSGGQRQRIAIARALLRNPKIMIFDEATSHLDCESERLIQEALETLSKGRTVFIVAHRLSTIRRADRIVVMEQGRIVEMGKHGELLAQRGLYHKFHSLQPSGA
ncbi:MAG TPA: ABC transporter ATP-binding protein [Candidatus Angelobacter sp.]|nr:ABC transporter ATP-binding protein [Candidatus Angelobacter sp.]